jgi:hypothetical protein
MFRNGFDFKVNDSILDQNGCFTSIYEQCLTLVCLYGNNTETLFTATSLIIPIEVIGSLKSKKDTIQLSRDKQRSTKHYTENERLCITSPLKTEGELRLFEG